MVAAARKSADGLFFATEKRTARILLFFRHGAGRCSDGLPVVKKRMRKIKYYDGFSDYFPTFAFDKNKCI